MLIINKVAVCIDQMQRPGVFLLFEKKTKFGDMLYIVRLTEYLFAFGNYLMLRGPINRRINVFIILLVTAV